MNDSFRPRRPVMISVGAQPTPSQVYDVMEESARLLLNRFGGDKVVDEDTTLRNSIGFAQVRYEHARPTPLNIFLVHEPLTMIP